MMRFGLLTERQLEILKLRGQGLTQEEIAKRLGTTRENVTIIERRALQNIKKARETLMALRNYGVAVNIIIPVGTHMVDIPRIIINKADEVNIKVKASFIKILEDLRFQAKNKIRKVKVIKPIYVQLMPNGEIIFE